MIKIKKKNASGSRIRFGREKLPARLLFGLSAFIGVVNYRDWV
jgi:hypothetical protein